MTVLNIRLEGLLLDKAPVNELEVCNAALAMLGAKKIARLDDATSDVAVLCASLYPRVRDAVLRAYPWNCAMTYTTIQAAAVPPAWGHAYRYPLPAEPWCLRVLAVEGSRIYRYKVVGRYIHTDAPVEIKVRYTARVYNPTEWDSLLMLGIITRLASVLAMPVTGKKVHEDTKYGMYLQVIREAKSADGQEGSADKLVANDFTDVR
jgi:hypothetical protein